LWDRYSSLGIIITSDKRGALAVKSHQVFGAVAGEPSTHPRRSVRLSERLSQARKEMLSREGSLSVSISDGDISNCNSHFQNPKIREEATKLWDLGKQFGLACRGDEEKVVQEYQCMEERDLEFMKNLAVGNINDFFLLIFNMNIRGLGAGTKARYLRRCISSEEVEFVCLQETKIVEVTNAKCFSLWGDNKVGWIHNRGVNGSKGLLSMWHKEAFNYETHSLGK